MDREPTADAPPRTGLGGFLFRRGLLIFSCACVIVACLIIHGAFNAQRTFRLGTQGLVRTAGWPDAPFATFDALQQHVRELGDEQGWQVVPRRGDPLEVTTNWFGDRRLRVLLDELREGP